MKVSVIIPAYNRENYIEECIMSVLKQDYDELEVVVVDDASTDKTAARVQKIAKKDSRVVLIKNKKNIGVAQARNIGINAASGSWIAFLDSDDYWLEGKLSKQVEFILKNKDVDICYSSALTCNGEGENGKRVFYSPEEITYRDMLKGNDLITSSALMKKEILLEFPFVSGPYHEDYILWLSALKKYTAKGLQEPLVVKRLLDDALTGNKIKSMMKTARTYKVCNIRGFSLLFYVFCNIMHGVRKYYIGGNGK